MKRSYVYIMATKGNSVLYIGVTVDLKKRVGQHKNEFYSGFTKKYKVNKLVYYEEFDYLMKAIAREKTMKKWKRQWKINVITEMNPDWEDLFYKNLLN